jgi:hypoxanthine-DNA glycosylase
LWDTIAACEREGSLDAAIRQAQANEFGVLLRHSPHLFRVCFNGKTSGKSAQRFGMAGFETLVLPSSSPAYAHMSFDDKLAIWKKVVDPKQEIALLDEVVPAIDTIHARIPNPGA